MPIIKILNRDYQISCNPGQESKLQELAAKLDKRLQENAKAFRGANDMMLTILTSLTLEDTVQELTQQNNALQKKLAEDVKCSDEDSNYLLDMLSERIDAISKNLNKLDV